MLTNLYPCPVHNHAWVCVLKQIEVWVGGRGGEAGGNHYRLDIKEEKLYLDGENGRMDWL